MGAARLALIGAPTSAGAFAPGQEQAPRALRDAGLLDALRDAGVEVVDIGDTPRWRWRPDPDHRRAQNAEAAAAGARAVAERVASALGEGRVPVVLGGDCTIELGTVAGALRAGHDPALVYFDLHPDLNTPRSVPDGALDWMGVAHLLGEPDAVPALVELGPRHPMLSPRQVVLYAHDPAHSTSWEREAISRLGIGGPTTAEVAREPLRTAAHAIERARRAAPRRLVHFDVDTVDFVDMPLSENTGRNYGLPFATAMEALDVLVADGGLLALTIAEVNPLHGAEDGSTMVTFAERLVATLAGIGESPG